MNSILYRSDNNVDDNNYKIAFLLIFFLIFKIFYTGIYPFINGNGNLYLIFKPLIIYLIYYIVLIIFNRKNNSYYIVLSLIISFIIPIDTPLYVFIIGSIVGNIISFLCKNKISSVVISYLLITVYLFNIDIYTGIFKYIYLFLIFISFIYLITNKLVKTRVLFISFILILMINIISNNFIFDISMFCLLFVVSDNRYTPVTGYSQVISSILFGVFIYIFRYILELNYYFFLSILLQELLSIIINYCNIKLYDNKVINHLFALHKI